MDLDGPAVHAEPQSAGAKRKRSFDFTAHSSSPMDFVDLVVSNGITQDTPDQPFKRPRLEEAMIASQSASKPTVPNVTDLPPEILQHIFSFVHPTTLGRLLPVCKLFNTLLNPVKALPAPSPGLKSLSLRKQNEIWTRSRNIHLQGYPRPMENMTEIEMWRLLRVRRCQFCHRKARRSPTFLNTTPWNGGPGPEDVRTIWPFRIRSCGSCLGPRLIMDKDLLLSASSFLADGLPFAFFTPSFHYVTTVNLDQNEPPPNLQLRKYFYRGQVDELEDKIIEVRALGSGAVEEWSKGLGLTGNMRRDDAARFEKWELTVTAHLHIQPGLSTLQPPARSLVTDSVSGSSVMSYGAGPGLGQALDINMTSPLRPSSAQSSLHSSFTTATSLPPVPEMPLHAFDPAPGQHRAVTPISTFPKAESVASGRTARSQTKPKPGPQEVERLRAEKRADIERRCQSIDPPIRISILPFMEAYNAAIQILRPLNDSAWDTLKHRLIAQREEAEHKELELLNNEQTLQLDEQERALYEEQARLDRATNDRIWDELGTPARQKLKSYADDHIATIWDAGMAVTAANSANFAADVLVHVVRRFDEGIVEEDKVLASRNMRLPNGSAIPEVRRLKLEDIKWVYDESVRSFTERFGKELFLCSVCEGTTKRFTFDGVIQHFAAKHTSDLSKGTQVVHWKADWPRDPPFHTYPESVWNKPPVPRPAPHSVFGLINYNVPGSATRPISPDGSIARSSTLADQTHRPGLYEQHCDEVTEATIDALHLTEGIKGLPDSVRLYVIVHRVVRSFRSKFPTNYPSLAMFIDCASHRSSLRSMRDLHGLRCKACSMERRAYQHVPKEYWLLELLSHFQASHAFPSYSHDGRPEHDSNMLGVDHAKQLEWVYDMIDLPHPQIIRNLAHAAGMDDLKFAAFRSLFPAIFARDGLDEQDRHYYSVTRYYIPLDQDRQQSGYPPMHRSNNSFDYNARHYHDPRDARGRDGPAYYPSIPNTRPAFLPTSPGFMREPPDDLRYRPRREIVYFDDYPGPGHSSAQASDARSHGDAPLQYQSAASASGPGKTYARCEPIYSPRLVEPHDLPLRLLHASGTPEGNEEADLQLQQHEVAIDEPRAPMETTPTQESGAQAADRFLNTFEPGPLIPSDGRSTSMSRTASIQRHMVPDHDTASVRSSRMSTPSRIRRDASSHPSQPVTRVDTPAESHYGRRTMSRNSVAAKSEASDAFRLHERASIAHPRTPPASQSPYTVARSSTQGYARSAEWYNASPPVIHRDHPETRPVYDYAVAGYSRAPQRYPPLQEYYDTGRPPLRFVSDRDFDEQRTFEQPVSPEMAQYEFSRHPMRETAYTQTAVPRAEFREAQFAPVSYSDDTERSRPAERHIS